MLRTLIFRTMLVMILAASAQAEQRLRLATTTSTDNSGLLAERHPPFEAMSGIKVDVIAVGTGKALKLGQNGDVDLVMVHAPRAEMKFVDSGFGVERLPIMHNDFVIIGPPSDPADVLGAQNLADVMTRISASSAGFISRGDDSGTHKKEMGLWRASSISPSGDWYLSVGQGMGAVLQIANEKLAYTLSDRGTYLAYRGKLELEVMYQGADELLNPYHVILVNPKRHPHVNTDLAVKYVEFLQGEKGQAIIGNFKVGGEQLFYPDVLK